MASVSGFAGLLMFCVLGGFCGHAQPHRYSNVLRAPLGLDTYFDYDEARTAARRMGKPLLLEFTGHAAINALRIERTVWPDSAILPLLRDKYVLVQLYTDDQTMLPKEEQVPSKHLRGPIRTLGNKWGEFEAERFRADYQPFYVILNPLTEKQLVSPLPVGDLSDTAKLAIWLRAGLAALPQTR